MLPGMRSSGRLSLLLVLLVLLAPACESKQKVCEHARDRLVEMTELDGKAAISDAPADQKSTAKTYADRITTAISDGFVEPCLELTDAERECLAKIDDFADATIEANENMLACSQKYSSDADFEQHCEKWSKDRKAAKSSYTADCVAIVDRLADAALKRAGI
jgi:hypothetical protein